MYIRHSVSEEAGYQGTDILWQRSTVRAWKVDADSANLPPDALLAKGHPLGPPDLMQAAGPAAPNAAAPPSRALCDQRKKGKEKWLSKGSSEPPARSRSCNVLVPRLYWMPTMARVSFSVMDTEPRPVTLKVFSP